MNNILSQPSLVKEIDAESFVVPSGVPAYGYWLRSSVDAYLETAVRVIRGQPGFALVPIFTEQAGNVQTQAIADGSMATTKEVYAAAKKIHKRANNLGIDLVARYGQNDRLIRFLLTRPDKRLEPVADWKYETAYRYPLLECLADTGQPIHTWLKRILKQNLVERTSLIDRTRHCTQCESTHLNYLDVCPHCHEIDIGRQKFIHCFSCGNVAPDRDFMHAGIMQCKVCSETLKHIGVDYDRPLESYACAACETRFEESLVVAKCLQCGQVDTPDKLSSRQIAVYQLSERGRVNALTSSTDAKTDLTNQPEFMVHYEVLKKFLSWNLAALRQNPEHQFTLIDVRITNRVDLRKQLGEHAAYRLIKQFTNIVGQSVRDTDMASSDTAGTIWLLLSPSGKKVAQRTLEKIDALCEQTRNHDNLGIEVRTRVVNAPKDLQAKDDLNTLLSWKDE